MPEQFIERGTRFPLRRGSLTLYETNCSCKDIQFYFDQYVMTIMVTGHKTIVSDHLKFEFFPGTFFVPEKGVINTVSIPNASVNNPTKCLVLELQPSFIQSVYEEVLHSELGNEILYAGLQDADQTHFLSNDKLLIRAFTKLYELQIKDRSPAKALIEELIIKEILVRVFSTDCLHLLQLNFAKSIANDGIRTVIAHIQRNIDQRLTTAGLAKIAGLGQTTFFRVFKTCTGQSPANYILGERIRQSKILMQRQQHSLQEIAFRCGFNSYEYFCSSFKKLEQMKPTDFKKSIRQSVKVA